MNLWVRDPDSGRLDTLETLAIYSLAVVLFKFIFSDVSLGPLVMGNVDSGVVAAILTPTLGALTFKKHSDNMLKKDQSEK